MEHGDAAIRAEFATWDRQIARLQERCLAASGPDVEHLRARLAELAAARERAWSRWELARAGGMWVVAEDVRRFREAMREAAAAFAQAEAAPASRGATGLGGPGGERAAAGGGG